MRTWFDVRRTVPIRLIFLIIDTAVFAGFATLILVGASAVSEYTFKRLPADSADFGLLPPAVKSLGWKQMPDEIKNFLGNVVHLFRNVFEGMTTVYEAFVTINHAFISAGRTAWAALHHGLDEQAPSAPLREEDIACTKEEEIAQAEPSELAKQSDVFFGTLDLKHRNSFKHQSDDLE
ncbi:hypothetical protein CVT26_008235 [Gymnopilus dilepis]|uniref:Uncharacterized protein n=1 Tax=Gymnopilus dilepis TaxID=231916 RepID=A0A409XXA0_9AGAR|nr:hypothetical protein CVT26_008235 [Gymnopilus dilepis]